MDYLNNLRIIWDEKNSFVVKVGKDFHTHKGRIRKEEFEKGFGKVKTDKGKEYNMITPNLSDLFRIIRRKPQIILQKDMGFIIASCGINKESIVVEGGTGSGASAIFLSMIAKKVYSYEIRKEHLEFSKKNIEEFGRENIILKNKSIYDIEEKDVDLVLLDVPEPWQAVESAYSALKKGAFIVSYLPNITQVMQLVEELNRFNMLVQTKEIFEQTWKVNEKVVRPVNHEFLTHTAFLVLARRIE